MEFIQQNVFLVVLAAVSGGMLLFDLLRNSATAGVSSLQATLLMNREHAIVVDVRDTAEFAAGHITSARNIPLVDLEKRIDELAKFKGKPVILVCASGARSARAQSVLAKAGFEKLHNLSGGMAGWQKDGQPVVKG